MNRIISKSACLCCEIQDAFDMFTINHKIESWLCPLADIDPVKGGRFELFWDPGNKERNSTIGCRITSIDYARHLSFEWKGPEQFKDFMNNCDPLTHVAVFFIPVERSCNKQECTKVQLLHTGWRNTKEWEEARTWFIDSWENALYKLEKIFPI